jgi:hypothetical protein
MRRGKLRGRRGGRRRRGLRLSRRRDGQKEMLGESLRGRGKKRKNESSENGSVSEIERGIAREIGTVAEIEIGRGTEMIDTEDTTILPAGEILLETLMIQPPSPSYPRMKSRGLSRKLWTTSSRKENGFLLSDRDINWSLISMRLLLHLPGKLCQLLLSSPSLENHLSNQMSRSLLPFPPNQKPTNLASKHPLRLQSTQKKKNWIVVRDDEAEAAIEARPARVLGVEAAIVETVETENQSDPGKIVENDQERAETAMIDGVIILEITMISTVETAENGTTDVDVQAEIGHALVLEIGGEQAIVHAVAVERSENVTAVAIEYVHQVLPPETLSSKNGS